MEFWKFSWSLEIKNQKSIAKQATIISEIMENLRLYCVCILACSRSRTMVQSRLMINPLETNQKIPMIRTRITNGTYFTKDFLFQIRILNKKGEKKSNNKIISAPNKTTLRANFPSGSIISSVQISFSLIRRSITRFEWVCLNSWTSSVALVKGVPTTKAKTWTTKRQGYFASKLSLCKLGPDVGTAI